MGISSEEIEKLLENFPNINREKFNDALKGVTCMMEYDKIRIYHCDIEKALYCGCGIENRDLYSWEWN